MKEKYFSINEAGSSIRCKLYYNDLKAVSRAVICVHGFGGHKDNKAAQRFAEHLLKKHKNAVAVTYDAPCHGDDVKKTLTLGDCDVYLREVIRHVTEHFTPEKCNAYATSFGGYQILKYIAEHGNPFGKIGLRCPAVRMYDVLSQRIISPVEQRMLMKNKPVAAAVVLFGVLDLGVLAHVEGVDAVVAAVLLAAVMDAAARNDLHVAVLTDEEVVIDHLFQTGLGDDDSDLVQIVFA